MKADDYFISDTAGDLEEAIRVAVRKRGLHRSRAFLLASYAPPGWEEAVRDAPPSLIRKAQDDLRAADEMRREDEEQRARLVARLLNLLRNDELRGALLVYLLTITSPEWSIPRRAADLYLAEHDVEDD
jgi:hypothetical protein